MILHLRGFETCFSKSRFYDITSFILNHSSDTSADTFCQLWHGSSCYRCINETALTWEDARINCKQLGAELVSIEEEMEQKALKPHLKDCNAGKGEHKPFTVDAVIAYNRLTNVNIKLNY